MPQKLKNLSTIGHELQELTDAVHKYNQAMSESENNVVLSFEQKVILAARNMREHSLKDFLDTEEVMQALEVLADIYTVTGITVPPHLCEG